MRGSRSTWLSVRQACFRCIAMVGCAVLRLDVVAAGLPISFDHLQVFTRNDSDEDGRRVHKLITVGCQSFRPYSHLPKHETAPSYTRCQAGVGIIVNCSTLDPSSFSEEDTRHKPAAATTPYHSPVGSQRTGPTAIQRGCSSNRGAGERVSNPDPEIKASVSRNGGAADAQTELIKCVCLQDYMRGQ